MNAWGVEPLKESFQLWAHDITLEERFAGFDIDPSTAGIEVIAVNETEETLLPPDLDDKVKGKFKFRARVVSEDGSSVIGDFAVTAIISFP